MARTRRSTDRIQDCGSCNRGPIPRGCTSMQTNGYFPVVCIVTTRNRTGKGSGKREFFRCGNIKTAGF